MKRGIIVALFLVGIIMGIGYGSAKAADVEVILGTSSGFTIVRGTSVSAGTSTFFVGSSTVSIGTTTQSAILTVVGSSTDTSASALSVRNSSGSFILDGRNDGAILIGTNTSSLNSSLYVGTISGSLGTITAGFLSIGTISANASLHGTTTVRFLAEVFANGTVTAGNFQTPGTVTVGTIRMSESSAGTLTVTGNLRVTGNFAAASKLFLIAHPDPEKERNGWVLRHSCVESPTGGDTLYRYKTIIQSDGGETSIPLPSYWPQLNKNPEVWVSAVGQFAQGYGYVDEASNNLIVKGEKKGAYTVLLIGTRKDISVREFDIKGVEFIDHEMSELLTRGEKKDAVDVQLIDAHSDHVIKNFMDPIVDRFGLATHQ